MCSPKGHNQISQISLFDVGIFSHGPIYVSGVQEESESRFTNSSPAIADPFFVNQLLMNGASTKIPIVALHPLQTCRVLKKSEHMLPPRASGKICSSEKSAASFVCSQVMHIRLLAVVNPSTVVLWSDGKLTPPALAPGTKSHPEYWRCRSAASSSGQYPRRSRRWGACRIPGRG